MALDHAPSPDNELLEWLEPEIRQLDIRETAIQFFTGGDGETIYPDCARS